ncbi:MAG: nuclear transport factor 2 family protein [Chloracidobacterium sp.]|nr:nuclear transport factor 2 family protein [Chloracidobacterium sp.]
MSNQNTQIEQEIIRLFHEWIEAVVRRDGDALDGILADDFLIAGWLHGGKLGDRELYKLCE